MIRSSTYPAHPNATKQKAARPTGPRSIGALAAVLALGACGKPEPRPLLKDVHIDTFIESCQDTAEMIAADLVERGELTGDWSDLRLMEVAIAGQPVGMAEVRYVSKGSVGMEGEHVDYDDLRLRVTVDAIGDALSRDRGILINLPSFDWEEFKASVDQLAEFPLPMSDYLMRAKASMVAQTDMPADADPELRRLEFEYFTRPQHLVVELGLGDLVHTAKLLPDGSPGPPE